jgi:hypothetical protein
VDADGGGHRRASLQGSSRLSGGPSARSRRQDPRAVQLVDELLGHTHHVEEHPHLAGLVHLLHVGPGHREPPAPCRATGPRRGAGDVRPERARARSLWRQVVGPRRLHPA